MNNSIKRSKLLATFLCVIICFSVLASSLAGAASYSNKYNLTISGSYIKGIPEKVTPSELTATMQNASVSFTNGIKAYVCTGCTITMGTTSYTAVINGDVDGSGNIDSTDYLKIKTYCLGNASLTGAYYEAADVDGNGRIDSTDYLRIKGHFVGTFDLFADSFITETPSEEPSEESSEAASSSEESSEETSDTAEGGTIHFTSSTVQVSGVGVSASGTTATITAAGEYKVTGSCSNGYILVQAGEEDNVKLNLSGVTLSSSENGPIFFESAKNGHIILADGTTNTISDSATYTNGSKAAIFAECDLKIKGNGTLNVTGKYKHALASDDEIFFDGGNVNVISAVNDGFHSNDGIYLSGGTATVKAAGSDAFESELVVDITGGALNASVTGEGIKAATAFTMSGGAVNVTAADNGIKSLDTAEISGGTVKITCSGNGVKATNSLNINGGTFTVNAGLDCFDASGDSTLGTAGTLTVNNGTITASSPSGEGLQGTYLYVKGGTIKVLSADNAFKGDSAVYVSGGVSTINCSGNGIKSDVYVAISGGETTITSSMGDGVKASDGVTVGKGDVDIIGGKLTITAKYDGIQADGTLNINNGYDGSSSSTPDNSEAVVSTNLASKANGGRYVISGGTVVTEELYSDPTWSADSSGYGSGSINDESWVGYTAGDWVEVMRSNGGVTIDFKLPKASTVQNIILNMGTREGSSNRGLPDSVTVYTSTDGINFDNVFGSIAGASFGVYQDHGYSALVSGNATNVKYVRIFAASSNTSNYVMRFGEIEIYDGATPSGTNVVIPSGYNITVSTNGGASNKVSAYDTESYKGIKGNNIVIKNCNMYINASDDAVHSNGSITMSGGKVVAGSGDDGFHAEETLTISGGEVEITQSNEGIEGLNIYVTGTAFVKVKASDDGFNAAGGADGSGGWNPNAAGNYSLNFSGDCFVYVNANGDGLDSNGAMNVSGGKIFCEGPTNGGNSSMDHNGALKITGGMLLSLGSSGMANECLSNATTSTQCAFATNGSGSAGTTLAIKNSSGTVLCVFKTTKQFQHIVFSASGLATGNTYQILTGVTGIGENTCGYYPSNQYTGGSQLTSVTQSSTITGGSTGGGPGGGFRPW